MPSVTHEQNDHIRTNPLLSYLRDGEILTSSELIGKLTADGATPENARQMLRRNSSARGVWRSQGLRLPKDERLFATQQTIGGPRFIELVGKKLRDTDRRAFARCLEALGKSIVLHKVHVMRLLGVGHSRVNGSAARRTYERELAALKEIGVTVVHPNTPIESVIAATRLLKDDGDQLAAIATAAVRKEAILARILVERLRRENVYSWNRVELPNLDEPFTTFNGQVFSAHGFSYLSPLVRWRANSAKPTACPVLVDVYHDLCVPEHVESFVQRLERATHRGKSALRSLGVIAAKDFVPAAWTDARRRGLWTVNLRQAFGEEALEAMAVAEKLLGEVAAAGRSVTGEDRFAEFSSLLEELKTNPVVSMLRSIGFEALSALALRSMGYEGIELGRVIPWGTTLRDVDVFGFRDGELRIIECKAYHRHKSIPAEDVTKFFEQTVPALKSWLRSNHHDFQRCHAEIWTTGPLGDRARDQLHRLKRSKSDKWLLVPRRDIQRILPGSIRDRGIELLEAIALDRHQDQD